MTDLITTGAAAKTLQRPVHQVRRVCDQLWPNTPRGGRYRLIRRDQLCELAAAIERRYGGREVTPA